MKFIGMSHLEYLDLRGNRITNVHNVHRCPRLKYLSLSGNRITRLCNLESLGKLQYLDASNNQLTTCKGLSGLTSLQFLDVSNNFLSSKLVDDVQHLGLLVFLDAKSNNIDKIPISENNLLLTHLVVDENELQAFDLGFWLPHLSYISCSRNRISSIGSLKFCQQLQSINLSVNQLSEGQVIIRSVMNNRNLRDLSIAENPCNEDEMFRKLLIDSLTFLEILDGENLMKSKVPLHSEPGKPGTVIIDGISTSLRELLKDVRNSISGNKNMHLLQAFHDLFRKCHILGMQLRKFHETGFIPETFDDDDDYDGKSDINGDGGSCIELINKEETNIDNNIVNDKDVNLIKKGKGGDSIGRQENDEVSKSEDESSSPDPLVRPGSSGRKSDARNVLCRVISPKTKRMSVAERIKRNQSSQVVPMPTSPWESVANGDRKCSADKAVVKIQALWRGHRTRQRIKQTYEGLKREFPPLLEVDFNLRTSALEDLDNDSEDDDNDDDDDDDNSYDDVIRQWYYTKALKMKHLPRLKRFDLVKQAWTESTDNFNFTGRSNQNRMVDSPSYGGFGPPSSQASSRRQSVKSHCSAREEELIKEWGFQDETTKELFLKRMRRMEDTASHRYQGGRRVVSGGSYRSRSKVELTGDTSSRRSERSSSCRFPKIGGSSMVNRGPDGQRWQNHAPSKIIDERLPRISNPSSANRTGSGDDLKVSIGWGSGKKRKRF